MDDRHTLSEPRPKSPSTLAWLVDIRREGVDEPIDTIEVSDETLPPRKKKGKVVWRLPSDHSRLVRTYVHTYVCLKMIIYIYVCMFMFMYVCVSILTLLLFTYSLSSIAIIPGR